MIELLMSIAMIVILGMICTEIATECSGEGSKRIICDTDGLRIPRVFGMRVGD